MKTKVNIVYLPYRRWHFSELILATLDKCQFKNFHLTVCGMGHHRPEVEDICNKAHKLGLSASPLIVTSSYLNYKDKLKIASEMDFDYSIKMDEDIFMGWFAWDYFFTNLKVLDCNDNLILAPTISSGIPTCDRFLKYSLNNDQQQSVKDKFTQTQFGSLWGAYYESLNNTLIEGYDKEKYYEGVSKLSHWYKGIHPIRVNFQAQKLLNQCILNNINQFTTRKDFFIEEMKEPYFCNSFFAIKNKLWNKILNTEDYYVDNFDEVPLNRYREYHGGKFLCIPNTFAIHTCYNTLWETGNSELEVNAHEEYFYQEILTFVKSQL